MMRGRFPLLVGFSRRAFGAAGIIPSMFPLVKLNLYPVPATLGMGFLFCLTLTATHAKMLYMMKEKENAMEKKICKACNKELDSFELGRWNNTMCYECDIKEYIRQCQILRANGMGW
jgi:hypothetical protein